MMVDLSLLGVSAALLAGAISFLSPCVLPLVPGYVSYVAGRTVSGKKAPSRRQAVWLSLCFVLGFSTIFISLGASATALGQALLRWRYELNIIGGGIVILFGLFMIGAARFSAMERDMRFHLDLPGGKPVSSYVLGLAFGFGWTPCIGPILGAILTASAASSTVADGITLLSFYSAGLGIPFLIVAGFTDAIAGKLRGIGRWGRRLNQAAGGVMILMGLAMVTGRLSALAYWLLDAFPVLARIG
ncbi:MULTISPECIES: cytochrome c biogenesis protein CcdA [Hyphomicrobiales]|jgi:cytochrome c-type biogenesis protein|uniref:cytochrome c biogenesis CcdA family protein n=1 Tax=Hyphomicrobiales TaxID=356 RepID=UPI001AFFAF6F|nr:cytochrome c biogenesis protein CcdA [Parvibaculum sp.]MBO6669766.1 cytochrome c biogenesis protein CcdA [Parvibaculum sp.]MBO6693412.1 cytochrome c biogenesis protein CcdA [Parvibaculum sp.]MBO6716273.1 cytochrome c biogenesis protein CcdA [Parvibaculum sp.]MBX3507740.1 cytochrome c biogenesis protein CcdA [Parvibaculum sp.]